MARKTARTDGLHYGARGIDRLYQRVWGDSIQFGCYPRPDLDLEAAVVETKRRMASLARLRPGQHVLEVASGWGATARYLARAQGVTVTATNIEDDHNRAARALTEMAGLAGRIRHAPADFHALPFADRGVDVWWCQEATVHARDKRLVFAEARRVLKPGGTVIFSDQTTDRRRCDPGAQARLAARHGSPDLYDAEAFARALAAAGLVDVRTRDWSRHMVRHFANLVRRIEENYDTLAADIPEETVAFNLSLWRFGRDLAAAGGIGWHCFTARRPPA